MIDHQQFMDGTEPIPWTPENFPVGTWMYLPAPANRVCMVESYAPTALKTPAGEDVFDATCRVYKADGQMPNSQEEFDAPVTTVNGNTVPAFDPQTGYFSVYRLKKPPFLAAQEAQQTSEVSQPVMGITQFINSQAGATDQPAATPPASSAPAAPITPDDAPVTAPTTPAGPPIVADNAEVPDMTKGADPAKPWGGLAPGADPGAAGAADVQQTVAGTPPAAPAQPKPDEPLKIEKCPDHPTYKGLKSPKTKCEVCWEIYKAKCIEAKDPARFAKAHFKAFGFAPDEFKQYLEAEKPTVLEQVTPAQPVATAPVATGDAEQPSLPTQPSFVPIVTAQNGNVPPAVTVVTLTGEQVWVSVKNVLRAAEAVQEELVRKALGS